MNLLATTRGRRCLFACLYLTEGAPIGFLWWALPTVMRKSGGDVDRIGAVLGFLVLPWACKFLWAPLVDVCRGPSFTFRAWILGAQVAMIATLLPLLWLDPRHSIGWLVGALVVHGFAAATQDVAIDGLAVATIPREERGSMNGWMQAGMMVGRAGFGGGGLLLREWAGNAGLVLALVGLLGAGLLLGLFYRDEPAVDRAATEHAAGRLRAFRASLLAVARSRATWFTVLFAATAGAAFEAAGGHASSLLLDSGATEAAVGRFFFVPQLVAVALGSLVGGMAADRLGHRRAVRGSGVLVAGAVAGVAGCALGAAGPSMLSVLFPALAGMYFAIGLFTATSYALFMDRTDPRLGATQFSAFMGATNLCEAWSVALGGVLIARYGYATAFGAMGVVTLAALLLLTGDRGGGDVERIGS
ncbi:MAG: MFS transporter [Planctomycetes bacterium]|nr:MFS transporter [Planctomycetota bacterium]